nr:FMN-binding split barrel [Tanacetum cinerariifolium]
DLVANPKCSLLVAKDPEDRTDIKFTNKEYKEAKVDQIYQFSKAISSHMNKDHGNDTKLIVQHSTSVPGRMGALHG